MNYEKFDLPVGILEYLDDTHTYIFDGVVLPSITQLISDPEKYKGIPENVLNEAAKKGTQMHKAIEEFEKEGKESDIEELYHYKFLKNQVGFTVLESETPVVLFKDGIAVAAGRLDQVIELNGKIGINDFKRTAIFDVQYVSKQTTLYALAYTQTYNKKVDFIAGTHLRENKRCFYKLLQADNLVNKLIEEL